MLLAWVAADRRAVHGAWLDGLRGPLEARGVELSVMAAGALARPTPERRERELDSARSAASAARACLLVEPERLPLETVVGALAAGTPAAVVDGPDELNRSARAVAALPLGPGAGPPAPSPALARGLTRAVTGLLPRIDPGADPAAIAHLLLELPNDAGPTPRALDPDLLAAVFALEEQYRRLADWTVDLAEHAADLERAGRATVLGRLRRRVRRFLRKRGLR